MQSKKCKWLNKKMEGNTLYSPPLPVVPHPNCPHSLTYLLGTAAPGTHPKDKKRRMWRPHPHQIKEASKRRPSIMCGKMWYVWLRTLIPILCVGTIEHPKTETIKNTMQVFLKLRSVLRRVFQRDIAPRAWASEPRQAFRRWIWRSLPKLFTRRHYATGAQNCV